MRTFTAFVNAPLAPTTLTYGDVYIIDVNNYNGTAPGTYQWVTLKALGTGTVIKFSNAAFSSSASANSSGNAITSSRTATVWTNTTGATIPAGTVITNDAWGNTTLGSCSRIATACGCGSTGVNMAQSTSGGTIFVYYGGTANSTTSDFSASAASATFNGTPLSIIALQGIQSWSNWLTTGTVPNLTTYLPSDLNAYSLFLGSSAVGATYTGPRTGGTVASFAAAILNSGNWTAVKSTHSVTFDNTNFTFAVPAHPPTFMSGARQNMTTCNNAGARSLNSYLKVNDIDTGETITYSLSAAPVHGTAVVGYTTTSTSGVISPVGLSYTPAPGFTGRDTFSVQVTDGTYYAVTTIFVLVNPSPSVPVISGSTYVCASGTTTLSASPTGGAWGSTSSNAAVVATTGVVTGISGISGTIIYNGPYNSYSCRSQAVYPIAIVGMPSAGAVSGATSVCPGTSFTLTPTVSGGTWSVNYPGIASVSASGVVTGVTHGSATVTYTVSNACRTATVRTAVTILGAPVLPGAIGGIPYVCEGGATITYTNSLAGGVWSLSNTSLATISSTATVTGITAGPDTVLYSYTNVCGVVRTEPKYITIKPLPNAGTISGAATLVRLTNTLLTASVGGGVWSSATPSLATINTGGRLYGLAAGMDTVKYTVTNTCGVALAIKLVSITSSRANNNNEFSLAEQSELSIFPNPANGIVAVQLNGAEGSMNVILTDIAGKVLASKYSENTLLNLDCTALPAGMYLVKVFNNGNTFTAKIAVQ